MSEIVLPSEILTPAELDVDNQHVQSLIAAGVGIFLSTDNLTTVTNVFNNTSGVASDITAHELGEQFNEYRLGADISSLSAQAQADINANPYQLFKIHEVVLIPVSEFTVGADPQWDYPNIVSGFEAVKNSGNTQRLILNDLEVLTSNYWLSNVGAGTHIEMVAASGREWNGIVGEGVGLIEGAGGNLISNLTKEQITLKGLEWRGFAGDYTVESCFLQAQGGFSAKNSLIVSSYVLGGVRTFNNQTFSANNSIIVGRFRNTSGAANMTVNNCVLYGAIDSSAVNAFHGNNNVSASSADIGTSPIKSVDFTNSFVDADNTHTSSVALEGKNFNINQAWADANLVNQGWNNSDILAWAYYVEAQIGTEQDIVTLTSEQLTETELVSINQFNVINAIVCEQVSQSQVTNLTQNNQISTIVTEQKTEHSLTAIANVNSIASVVCEQLTQSAVIDNTENQVIYAAHAQQLTQALTVNITTDAAQDINVVVTEQETQSQAISVNEAQQLQAIISEQLTQALHTSIEQSLTLNAITTEQLTEAVTVTIDESSGIFVSVVQTEQLTQAVNEDVDVTALIGAVITEQLTQCSTDKIHVDINVSTVVAEQLTQAELIAIIQGDIATALNIDIDQITLEILTPTYSVKSLTPTYTIEHIH